LFSPPRNYEQNLARARRDVRRPEAGRSEAARTERHGHCVSPFHEAEHQRWREELQTAHDASCLPELPVSETHEELNELLVRVRLKEKYF
jgi:hypothetical protein